MQNKATKQYWKLGCALLLALTSVVSQALPAFARQTGQNCVACHVSFPELTPYGRMFKLNGYTIGKQKVVPLAAMAIASTTHVANQQGNSQAYPRNGDLEFESASLFLAGKLGEHVGAFSQWTYNNLNPEALPNGGTKFTGHFTVDNNDWRVADRITQDGTDLIYGASVNNNPTVQDVWNSTPGFSYPYQTSRLQGAWGIGWPATLIEGALAQQSAGMTAYMMLDKHFYAEFGAYRAANGAFRIFSENLHMGTRLKAGNPYWRFAYSGESGADSFELGTFGMAANVYVDPLDVTAGRNRYRDFGVDAQYQHLLDPHVWTAQASFIHEKESWDPSLVGSAYANSHDTLNSFHLKGSYWYNRRYGATLGYFAEHGSTDALANANPSGKPDATGWIGEFNYMIEQNWRLGLQYTAFQKYQGGSSNYDGNGRNARDNNITYLYTWYAY